MKNVTMIAAIGRDNELGKDGKMLWHIDEDLRYFKKQTMGKPIVMGLNTFYSLPRKLEGRRHIVLTKRDIDLGEDIMIKHSLDEMLDYIRENPEEFMIIGGASVYEQFMAYADKMHITRICKNYEADCFFPNISYDEWSPSFPITYEDYPNYSRVVYTRKRNFRE